MTNGSARPSAADILELVERKCDVPTICEGKRDVAALRQLGFTQLHPIDVALYALVERFEKGSVVQILTDLDSEGKKLYRQLQSDLRQRGVFVDDELRELLFRTQLRQIEGLANYVRRL